MNLKHILLCVFTSLLVFAGSVTAEELVGTPVGEVPQTLQPPANPNPSSFVPDQGSIDREIEARVKQHINQIPSQGFDADFGHMILVPIVAIIVSIGGGFFFIIALVVTRYRAVAQKRTQQQELIQKFLDAGRDVPEELLSDFDGKTMANLSRGIRETLIGLAIMIFLTVLIGFEIGAVGLIIVAAGLSRVAIWKLSQPQKSV